MPTFDFVCKQCGKKEEVFQKHDDPAPKCEEGHGEMSKELSPHFIRKGGGLVSLDVGETKQKFGDFK